MKTNLAALILIITIGCLMTSVSIAQPISPIFKNCSDISTPEKRVECEKGILIDFIYAELWSYFIALKKEYPDSNFIAEFKLDKDGLCTDLIIKNTNINSVGVSNEYFFKSIIIHEIHIADFIGAETCTIYYDLPNHMIQDFDTKRLRFELRNEVIYKVVEQMPRFPGCEHLNSDKERDECAKQKMLDYIYKNLVYPPEAKNKNTQGQVVLQFIIEKDGTITHINIRRDIGDGCGKAAVDVIETMNHMSEKWVSGEQRGRPVRVLYTLPVKFRL
ncbi:MAG: energy transducer TonB [Saprospiraceae bacterium]